MGAAELLNCLRDDGLVLTLIAGGGIHAAPRDALTDQHRGAIRAARDALVLVLQAEASCQTPTPTPPSIAIPPSTRRSGNPLMTPKQSGDCHADGWSDTEIKVFMMREARFIRLGRVADAEHVAERLTLRDRKHDDRRMCLKCAALVDNGRCGNHRRAGLKAPDVGRDMATVLQRCADFQPSK